MFSATPASAQKVPEPLEQEILIKGILMSFNDANITDNYTVFHARLAKRSATNFRPSGWREPLRPSVTRRSTSPSSRPSSRSRASRRGSIMACSSCPVISTRPQAA
jgi:hypothetical protein